MIQFKVFNLTYTMQLLYFVRYLYYRELGRRTSTADLLMLSHIYVHIPCSTYIHSYHGKLNTTPIKNSLLVRQPDAETENNSTTVCLVSWGSVRVHL